MKHVASIALAIVATLAVGCASDSARDKEESKEMTTGSADVSSQDRDFVAKATQSSQAEIELARLAQEKSTSPAIQQFADRMLTDHRNANTRLMQAASQEGIVPPQTLDPRHAQMRDRLSQLDGRQFDQEYLSSQVRMHQEAVDLFRKQANNGDSPELRSMAEETLPVLEGHLALAQQLANRAGVSFTE